MPGDWLPERLVNPIAKLKALKKDILEYLH